MRMLKRNIKNLQILFVTAFMLFSQAALPLTVLTSNARAAGQITFGAQFQNQTFPNDPNIWTNGQLDNYSEGDFVNFRFDLTATDGTSAGTMQVEFDLGSCSFFTNHFNFVSTTPAIASVTEGTQVLVSSGGGGSNDYYKQDLGVSFSSAGTTTVIFTLQLSNTAGDCTGSSTGVRLGVPATGNGDFDNAGAKTLPMSANSVLENPSLTITKAVEGGDALPADFYFTISPGITGVIDGVVVTGQTEIHIPTGENSVTINEVNPDGVFTVSENGPAGYDFAGGTGTSCEVTNAIDGVMQATLIADPSNPTEAICNFSNESEPEGNIVVVKETHPDGDQQSFEFNPSYDNNFSLSDGQTNDSGPLTPGVYSVSELVPQGWTLTSAVCIDDDGNSTPDSINLSDDETVTCTFTNTKQAQITVKKDAIPNDPQNFTFTNNFGNGNDAIFQLDNDGTVELPSERTFYVLPGTGYTVSEQDVDGWKLSSAECDLDNTIDDIDVAAGEHVTCTFTNKKLGSVTIIKTAIGGNGTFDYTMTGDTLPASTQLITALGTATETFMDIDPENTYSIAETPQDGWDLESVYCENENQVEKSPNSFSINNGGNVTCTFTNHKDSLLTLQKTVINDNGGSASAGDWNLSALLGAVTWIDEAPTIHIMASPTSETMATATYVVDAGTYDLSEFSNKTGYTPSDSWHCGNASMTDADSVTVPIGGDVTCTITNDDNAPTLKLVKEVTNDNGGIAEASDWTLSARKLCAAGDTNPDCGFSDSGDSTTFYPVLANQAYRLFETGPDGYTAGDWSCDQEGVLVGNNVTLGLGDDVICTIINDDQPGDVRVTKFNDLNRNGFFDDGESTLEGWEMNLYKFSECGGFFEDSECEKEELLLVEESSGITLSKTTGDDGTATFEELETYPSALYELYETPQDGWYQTGIYCEDLHENGIAVPVETFRLVDFRIFGDNHHGSRPVFVHPGETVDCFVGNAPNPVLEIAKTNNRPEPVPRGEVVVYTVTVSIPEDSGCVYGSHYIDGEIDPVVTETCPEPHYEFEEEMPVQAIDLPPEGVTYVEGSWTAVSNLRGNLKTLGITTEPIYASPGTWNLTNDYSPAMLPGETIILTYEATVESDVTSGEYPDSVFAAGTGPIGAAVYSNVHITGDNPFVGTQISVIDEVDEEQGFVLGTLAVTGVPAILSVGMGLLVATGAILLSGAGGNRKKRGLIKGFAKPLLMLAIGLGISLFVFSSAFAAGFWTTNLSTPEAYTRDGVVNLDYQVLSTQPESPGNFVVTLLKDGSPTVLTDSIPDNDAGTNDEYGNSGRFALILPDEGTFKFQISTSSISSASTKLSDEVTVTYDKTAPAPATYDGVVRSGNTYTISFTAPTGNVSSVDVYASTQTSFNLDESTLVGSVAVTPGESSQFVYTAPDSTQRYFAITAVDAAGNQSTATGDEVVTTTVTPAPVTPGAVGGATGDGGTVGDEGAQTDTGLEGVSDGSEDGEEDDEEDDDSNTATTLIIVLLIALALVGAYFYFSKQEQNKE